jgi:transcriptional regulator with XRE-family HTH domain
MSIISDFNTDGEVLAEVGERLRWYRLRLNLTVADVATRTGLNRNTVLNAEAGRNPRLETVVRLLRAYGRLEALDAFLPVPAVSPLQVIRDKARERRRAGRRRDG